MTTRPPGYRGRDERIAARGGMTVEEFHELYPKLKIITGRGRPQSEFDAAAVFAACRDHGVAVASARTG